MHDGLIECKECRFWIQYVQEDPILGPKFSDYGLCFKSRSVNWFLPMRKDMRCGDGELKKHELLAH